MALNKFTKDTVYLAPQTAHIIPPKDQPCLGAELNISGYPACTGRLVDIFIQHNQLVAVISSNACGATKSGEFCIDTHDENALNLVAENSRIGWIRLHRQLRLHFTPFNFS